MAQRTDVVTLFNGNAITGEIKELYRGLLKYKTDSIGTIYIEWLDIKSIKSDKTFTVETAAGVRAFGALKTSADFNSLEVTYVDRSVRLDKFAVVVITPIKDSFLSRLDGSIEGGLNFRKANRDLQLNFNVTIKYISRQHIYTGGLSATTSTRNDDPPTERYLLNFSHQRYLRPKWSTIEGGELEQNTELDLRLRALILGGGLHNFVNNNRTRLQTSAGLALNDERYFTIGKGDRTSMELFGAVGYEFFQFNTPKADFVLKFTVFPSLTESRRLRTSFSSVLSWEIISDLTFNLRVYASTDNQPPAAQKEGEDIEASGTDYGVTTSLGWTF